MPNLAFVKKMMWWTVLAAVVVIPLFITWSAKDAFRAPKDYVFTAICIVLMWLMVAAVLAVPRFRFEALRESPPIIIVSAAAIAWGAICTLLAENRVLAVHSLIAATMIAFFIVVTWWLARDKDIRAVYVIAIPAAVNAAVFLMQRFRIWDPLHVDERLPEHFRYSALLGNPNDVASFFVAPALAIVTLAIVDRPRRLRWSILAAFVLAAVVSGSLTAIVACAVGLFAIGAMQSRRRAFAAAGVVIVLLVAIALGFAPLRQRLMLIRSQIQHGDYMSAVSGRITPFLAALRMSRDHPVAGVGPGGFAWEYFPYKLGVERDYPQLVLAYASRFNFGQVHNDHLQILAECGIIGYLIALAAFYLLARGSFRSTGDASPRGEFARLLSFPLSAALFVLCIAHFPLHLVAAMVGFGFIAALCMSWSASPRAAAAETTVRTKSRNSSKNIDATIRVKRKATAPDRVRIGALVLAAGVAAFAFHRFVILPYRCNILKGTIERVTLAAYDAPAHEAPAIARTNLALLHPCRRIASSDVDIYMLIAANQRLLNRLEEAAATYRTALAYDRRPEIFYNLAMVELDLGQRAQAMRDLQQAVIFNSTLLNDIPYEDVRAEVRTLLARDYPHLAAIVGS